MKLAYSDGKINKKTEDKEQKIKKNVEIPIICRIFALVKILKRIISIVIWTVIALNLLTAGLLHLPGVQQFFGEKVSALLEEQLGTKVSVGQIDLGILNRIIIDDVLIYDQQQQEMLRVARLSVKIDYMPLTEGKIHISSAQLFGAHAHLYRKDSLTAPNFQFVID